MPTALVKEIVKLRLEENAERRGTKRAGSHRL
jgi:hypothetical protein